MKIAFATCAALPDGWADDHPVAELVGADYRVWDDEAVDWAAYDRVVLRSVWDYTARVDQFVAWCTAVGPQRLRNTPELVAFNADKRYLAELSAPSVPTIFVAPGDDIPVLQGRVVVKPNVSAGGQDTGRFAPPRHGAAVNLIKLICASGRIAMVQPYLTTIEERGETAVVFIGGRLSHILHKRPVLEASGVVPVVVDPLPVAAVMLEDDLVTAGTADQAQLALASAIHDELSARFGVPLYARVDLVEGPDGAPALLELEAIEPCLYLTTAPGSAEQFARAITAG